MNAQHLKNSILQLAIQGKLVEQREEEGTAKELIEKIKTDKEKLIKEKRIKKEKPLPEIIEDEIPFDIPVNWEWVRLGDCCLYSFSGRSPKYTKIPNDNIAIGQRNNQNYGLDFTHLKYCTDEFMKNYNEDMFLKEYDILLNTLGGGTVGRTGLYNNPYGFKCITDGHLFVFRTGDTAFQKYLYYVLKVYQRKIEKDAEGSTNQSFLKLGNVKSYLMPIPPLKEQKRIVAKIEELMPYVEKYNKAYSEVEDLNKKFPEDMQKSILQYAIQGKLVEQREEEGTAEELYQQIQEEREKLVKEGKLKKTKALPEITEDEIPFDIPENWKWVSVGQICSDVKYGTSKKSSKRGKMPVLRMGNIQSGIIDYTNLVYSSDDEDINKYRLNKNDLLFNRTNSQELVGKTAIYKGEIPAIYAGYLVKFTLLLISSDYLNFVMQSNYYWRYCQTVRSDAIGQSNINAEKLKQFVFPLPPLAEQKRIVEKIEELLPYTKQLVK